MSRISLSVRVRAARFLQNVDDGLKFERCSYPLDALRVVPLMKTPSPPVLSSPCKHMRRTLWFGQIELFDDHITLSGWCWTGRYERRIDLSDLQLTLWWAVGQGMNFKLQLESGKTYPLRITEGAGLWHWKLKEMTDSTVRMAS